MKVKYEITEDEKNKLTHILRLIRNEHERDFIQGRNTLVYTKTLNNALSIFDIIVLDEKLMKEKRSNNDKGDDDD